MTASGIKAVGRCHTDNIAAIIAIEPGGAPATDSEEFKAVSDKKIPVAFYFGDYIDNGDEDIAATGMWQGMKQASQAFVDGLKKNGVTATMVDLPKEGIKGNTHFIFQDKNSDQVAEHVENWIKENVKQ